MSTTKKKDNWIISLDELEFEKRVGKGKFGEVWKGDWLGIDIAIKRLYFVDEDFMKKYINRETSMLKDVHHPNIIQTLGICTAPQGTPPRFKGSATKDGEASPRQTIKPKDSGAPDVYIVTEFMPHGDLAKVLANESVHLSWPVRVGMMKDLALAMNYLHTNNIMHR